MSESWQCIGIVAVAVSVIISAYFQFLPVLIPASFLMLIVAGIVAVRR